MIYGVKIYRTDEMGEVSIVIDNKGKTKIKKFIKWIKKWYESDFNIVDIRVFFVVIKREKN